MALTDIQIFDTDDAATLAKKIRALVNEISRLKIPTDLQNVTSILVGPGQTPPGSVLRLVHAEVIAVTAVLIAAAATRTIVTAVTGVLDTDIVVCSPKIVPEAGITWCACAGTDAINIRLANVTAGGITPIARDYAVAVYRFA